MVLLRGRNGFMHCVFVPLVVVVLCDAKHHKEKACSMPDLPAHIAYLCLPPLCQGPQDHGLFESSTILEFFCKPGYILASRPALAICQEGKWSWMQGVTCQPQGSSAGVRGLSLQQPCETETDLMTPRKFHGQELSKSVQHQNRDLILTTVQQDGRRLGATLGRIDAERTSMAHPQNSLLTATSMSIIAGVALTLLAFLVTFQSCVLLRKRPSVCHCHSGHYEIFEDLDTMEHVAELDAAYQSDRSVDSLPSYEEVVNGHLGNSLPHDDWDLGCWVPSEGVLAQSEPHHLAEETPDSPPPSYQDALAMAVSVGVGSGDGSGEGGPGREQGMTDPNGTSKSWVPGKMDFSVSIEL